MILDMLPPVSQSYITNCYIDCEGREPEEGLMFEGHSGGTITVRLDGYAIVPKEKYENMVQDLNNLRCQDTTSQTTTWV